MTGIDTGTFWITVLGLGCLTFLTRFLFLGVVKHGALPASVIRLLRYVPVTVLPALIAPMVVFPRSLDGATESVWIVAALITLAVGMITRNMFASIVAGMGSLWTLQWLVGLL